VKLPFFTIGNSNRSLEAFVELLKGVHIDLVADIRTVPRPRANPQFNKDTLPDALAAFDISYEDMAALAWIYDNSGPTSHRTGEKQAGIVALDRDALPAVVNAVQKIQTDA
jgi:uncharacterized protein (DUF488 family)